MSTVETVQGSVEASELGVTLIHEHLRFRDEAVAVNWPGRYDEQAELDAALEQTRAAQAHGVSTIVDPTAMFGGRDVRFLQRVAQATGVHVVACPASTPTTTFPTTSRTATRTRSPSTSSTTSPRAARAPTSRPRS
jgi:phosphotriesterase-related protein